ncbi:transforming acidic coiled-coil-containing protein 3 [Chanos chanos]|uniref:Transforming acidic coiled-coil-containing protein 3 n=1 Tax=Chanos chanos TaxID=29144 RepID=A0A6J2VAJ4_CHACN|nr:transforming acidic coiled-coil-containing protein 3 [Chanos chanos]
MTSLPVNDENRGVYPGRKYSGSETSCDIFALEQPTGRPSILRQSQVDNVPSKPGPKGVKVCFQTPRRDPITKKIVSPNRTGKMSALADCTKALETQKNGGAESVDVSDQNDVPYPDDDMPIVSKGGYNFDFDNLDAINPFQGSTKMTLSPPRPFLSPTPQEAAEKNEPTVDGCSPKAHSDSEKPIKSENALDETLPFIPSVENSIADVSTEVRSTDSSVIIELKNPGTLVNEQGVSDTGEPEVSEAAASLEKGPVDKNIPEVQESPLPPKGSYNFDFDNFDSINPFQTGGSKICNSPVLGKKPLGDSFPATEVEAKISESKQEESENALQQQVVQEVPETKPSTTETVSDLKETAEPAEAPPAQPSPVPNKGGPMVLEFNFDDGTEVKRKPPPKHLGKRPSGTKSTTKKTVVAPAEKKGQSPSKQKTLGSPVKPEDSAPSDIPVGKGTYSFDFDKFDEPNFNPFGTKNRMTNSPPRDGFASPVIKRKDEPSDQAPEAPAEQVDQPSGNPSLPSTGNEIPKMEETSTSEKQVDKEHSSSVSQVAQSPVKQEQHTAMIPEPSDPDQPSQISQDLPGANEEFVPGTMFMSSDFDGQIDYLEQFGSSSFKESALRKQSLYLKFDPLLRESPKKAGASTCTMGFNLPRPSLAARMESKTELKQEEKLQTDKVKLLDDFPVLDAGPLAQDPAVLDLLVPTFRQPVKNEDAIIEVLKYSQKDMDAALETVQKEAQAREEEWKAQCEQLRQDNHHMGIVMSEFEATVAKIMAEREKEREAAQAELNKVLQEKEQVVMDLNAMEHSFSELFKRLNKHKEVIEGYKKNEETLKLCAQDYMARIKKEEQRYQSLKAHAEEKINQANQEIAEVRSKLKAEVSALKVQLKREQLKVQSLEKSLDQKTKEVEEVTKLCDELIANVEKR